MATQETMLVWSCLVVLQSSCLLKAEQRHIGFVVDVLNCLCMVAS